MARSITTRSTNPKIMDDNIKILDDALAIASAPEASDVSYDNTDSGLTATNAQAAIDEVSGNVSALNNNTLTLFSSIVDGRVEVQSGGYYKRGNMAFVNVKFKALTEILTVPAILATTSPDVASADCALTAYDVTTGISNVGEVIPCGIDTRGYIFISKIQTNKIYQISGWFLL